jgi:hypothetical protein
MTGDDRLDPLARWVFLVLVPLTAVFGPLLVLNPGHTASYWSWTISPSMSAVWVGAGYTFGACAITTMLVLNRWRTSIIAIVATIPFAVAMLVATLLHLDRFATGTVRFAIWMTIYVLLPVGLVAIYLRGRRADPGVQPTDEFLPLWVARTGAAVGVLVLAVGLLLFVAPSTGGRLWPWPLTPLMAQVVAGWLFFFGGGAAMLGVERRFLAVQAFLPSVVVWSGVLGVVGFFHLDDFTRGPAATAGYFTITAVVAVGSLALWAFGSRITRAAGVQPANTSGSSPM